MTPLPSILVLLRILPETERLAEMGVRVGIGILVGLVAQRLLFLVVGRVQTWIVRVGRDSPHARQRSQTIGQIFRNLITLLVTGAVVIHALGVLGWDVKPLLAGAGILGVALGFGAQALVRDVIAGLFIIAEDQFAVGDLIEVNGKAATVEALTVRSTTLRDFNGHLHFVPNGEMKIVTNRSRGWNRLAVDVPVAADENLDRALELCGRIAAVMSAETAWRPRLLDEVQLWGVEALGPTGVSNPSGRARPARTGCPGRGAGTAPPHPGRAGGGGDPHQRAARHRDHPDGRRGSGRGEHHRLRRAPCPFASTTR